MNEYLAVLRKYAVFTGRARRREYWIFLFVNVIIVFLLALLTLPMNPTDEYSVSALSLLYGLAIFIPELAVSVRRLHDTGRSGWWLAIGLLPLLGAVILFVFAVQDSQPGANRFGPNPKTAG